MISYIKTETHFFFNVAYPGTKFAIPDTKIENPGSGFGNRHYFLKKHRLLIIR